MATVDFKDMMDKIIRKRFIRNNKNEPFEREGYCPVCGNLFHDNAGIHAEGCNLEVAIEELGINFMNPIRTLHWGMGS